MCCNRGPLLLRSKMVNPLREGGRQSFGEAPDDRSVTQVIM